jgi:hypothetical protein
LAGLKALAAFRARENAAAGRKDARHANEIARGDPGRTERELKGSELLAVLADALREKHLLGNESDHVVLLIEREEKLNGKHQVSQCQGTLHAGFNNTTGTLMGK